MIKCPMCDYSGLVQGQLFCPECDHDLSSFWSKPSKPPVEEKPFDPFAATPAAKTEAPAVPNPEELLSLLDLEAIAPTSPGGDVGMGAKSEVRSPVMPAAPARPLVAAAPPVVPAPVAAPRATCPGCKAEIDSGIRFCDKCGLDLQPSCPRCTKSNRAGARFCQSCGSPLAAVAAVVPPAAPPVLAPPVVVAAPVSSGTGLLPVWEPRVRRFVLLVFGRDGTEVHRVELKQGDNHVGVLTPGEQIEVDLTAHDRYEIVSRRHAILRVQADVVTLIDSSRNGTWVNGKRATPNLSVPLDENAEIVFADVRCRLKAH